MFLAAKMRCCNYTNNNNNASMPTTFSFRAQRINTQDLGGTATPSPYRFLRRLVDVNLHQTTAQRHPYGSPCTRQRRSRPGSMRPGVAGHRQTRQTQQTRPRAEAHVLSERIGTAERDRLGETGWWAQARPVLEMPG